MGSEMCIRDSQYSAKMPVGEISDLGLSQKDGRVFVTITAHESARRNPFVLLESLISLNNVASLDAISASKMTMKHGTSFKHHGFDAFHSVYYSLANTLGLASQNSYDHSTGQLVGEVFTPIELGELKANAEGGSILSKRKIAELNAQHFQLVKLSLPKYLPLKSMTENQKKAALIEYAGLKGIKLADGSYEVMMKTFQDQVDLSQKRQLETLNAQAKKTYQAQIQKYKDGAAEREQVIKTKSLPDMIKANDREGVAQAMEKMLPWSIMEPTEESFWKDFVDSIRSPNYDKSPILFRGMDANEKLQAVTDSTGKIVSGGLFSKRLTAGSGSHLFKLKGLPETFESFGTKGNFEYRRISPLNTPHTLTKMMINHAMDPRGSPFISLTYDLSIAYQFGSGNIFEPKDTKNIEKAKAAYLNSNASGGVITVRIDPRRLITNSVSGFTNELEVLASMFIFPDEVLYMQKGVSYSEANQNALSNAPELKTPIEEYYKNARSVVFKKTGVNLPESYEEYMAKSGQKAFYSGLIDVENRFEKAAGKSAPMCSKIF